MGSSTWIFGLREVRADEHTSMHLAVLLTVDDVLAHSVFDDPPTDVELRALYDDTIDGGLDDGQPCTPPKRILVENAATAKRVRPLFKRGARVEIERSVSVAIDALVHELIDISVDHELFEALPGEWKPELIELGAALSEAAPWRELPARVLRAAIPSLGVDGVELALMGQKSFGFVVYTDGATRRQFLDAAKNDSPRPRVVGLELTGVMIDGALAPVAGVEARGARGPEDPTEAEIQLCATLARFLLAYLDAGPPIQEARALEVAVRGELVRGTLTLVG